MLISQLFENPAFFIILAITLVFSMSVHEFTHAFVANKLGDDTPKNLGRLTLNPKAHLDLVGTIMLLLFGFGWGKPVPVNPYNLKFPKRDSAIISFAGPLANFLIVLLVRLVILLSGNNEAIVSIGSLIILYNLFLGIFNLIPVYPLDGFKVVAGLLPSTLYIQWMQLSKYGVVLLLVLVFTDIPSAIIFPLVSFFMLLLQLPLGV